jgi:hypothetical protein
VIKVSEFKNSIILETSKEIADFINKKYGIAEEELYIEVAEFVNTNMSFLFDTVEELAEKFDV